MNVTSISNDKRGLSIKVIMDVRIVQILKDAIVVCETNSCEQIILDPVDDEALDRFVRDDLGNRTLQTWAKRLRCGKVFLL